MLPLSKLRGPVGGGAPIRFMRGIGEDEEGEEEEGEEEGSDWGG